jgi:hypothetical protein
MVGWTGKCQIRASGHLIQVTNILLYDVPFNYSRSPSLGAFCSTFFSRVSWLFSRRSRSQVGA